MHSQPLQTLQGDPRRAFQSILLSVRTSGEAGRKCRSNCFNLNAKRPKHLWPLILVMCCFDNSPDNEDQSACPSQHQWVLSCRQMPRDGESLVGGRMWGPSKPSLSGDQGVAVGTVDRAAWAPSPPPERTRNLLGARCHPLKGKRGLPWWSNG